MDRLTRFTESGGWWALAQVPLIVAGIYLPDIDGVPDDSWGMPVRLVGWAIAWVAILLFTGSMGALVLRRALTPMTRPLPNASLVTHGLYRLMRHPLYTSMIVGMFGWALIQLSVLGLAYVGVVALFFDRKAAREERLLAERYPEYVDYALRVRRFIPGVY